MRNPVLWAGLAAAPAAALIGFGIEMYNPTCAHACRSSIASFMLSCSDLDHAGGGHSHGGGGPTSPECRATDTAFLTTLAWCISTTCRASDPEPWIVEKFWEEKVTGDPAVQPEMSYGETIATIEEEPTEGLEAATETEMLNYTAVVDGETWTGYFNTHDRFEQAENTHSAYGIILVVIAFGLPILVTLASHLPFASKMTDKLNPYLTYPSIWQTYHTEPLPHFLGNAPTSGQATYVAIFLAVNVIVTAAGYEVGQPNMWFADTWEEVMGYLSARTGVLAFAILPVVMLFSTRNNVLLWLTNWSHSTYMLLHRWVARMFVLQVVLHSITEFILYDHWESAAEEAKKPYWIWGIVATLCACIMVVISVLWFRQKAYEVFRLLHIVLAVFVLVGSWYHVELLFTRKWGYEMWLYAAFAVWVFDRTIRVLRTARNGVRRATVTPLTSEIVRVDVPGVRWSAEPGRHAYIYFPALAGFRHFYENHPFSVVSTALLSPSGALSAPKTKEEHPSSSEGKGDEAGVSPVTGTARADSADGAEKGAMATRIPLSTSSGVTFYVRKMTGMTARLAAPAATGGNVLALLDGPYDNSHTSAVLKTDRLVVIAGGIGITGVLGFLPRHGNVKLCWSVREECGPLVDDLEGAIAGVAEKDVRIGTRLDVGAILDEEERTGWDRVGVVVCGPGGLCDTVRALVAAKGQRHPDGSWKKTVWELEVEAFSW